MTFNLKSHTNIFSVTFVIDRLHSDYLIMTSYYHAL